jgi:hypothetical protein
MNTSDYAALFQRRRADDAYYTDDFYETNQPEPEHPTALSHTPSGLSPDFLSANDDAHREFSQVAREDALVRAGINPRGGA